MEALQRGRDHVVADGSRRLDAQAGIPQASTGPRPPWSRMDAPRIRAGAPRRASTGPRPRGRGWMNLLPPQPELPASTRPRPRGRGWERDVDGWPDAEHASTGPRPRGRGWVLAGEA